MTRWLLAFILLGTQTVCGENTEPQFKKIYVQPNDIVFHNDQILIHSNNQWLLAESIHADAAGIYAKAALLWFCKKCHYHNEDNDYCANCGSPRP